jgi:hypothetical protein
MTADRTGHVNHAPSQEIQPSRANRSSVDRSSNATLQALRIMDCKLGRILRLAQNICNHDRRVEESGIRRR